MAAENPLFVMLANNLSQFERTDVLLALDDMSLFPPRTPVEVERLINGMQVVEEWRVDQLQDEHLAHALDGPLGGYIDQAMEMCQAVMINAERDVQA